MCPFKIYDIEEKEFIGVSFAEFEMAEKYIEKELDNDFVRYEIYEKIS